MTPSALYRRKLRSGLLMLMGREHWPLLMHREQLNDLRMDDLEALFELVFGWEPRRLAPPEYRTTRGDPVHG